MIIKRAESMGVDWKGTVEEMRKQVSFELKLFIGSGHHSIIHEVVWWDVVMGRPHGEDAHAGALAFLVGDVGEL